MKHDGSLLVVPSLMAGDAGDGCIHITRKFIDGARAYVELWPGQVMVCMRRREQADNNLDVERVRIDDLPFAFRWMPDSPVEVQRMIAESSLVLASLVDRNTGMPELGASSGTPVVFISEYSLTTRRQIIASETRNPLLRWHRSRWARRMEGVFHRCVEEAAGIQCNGTPTFDAYRKISENPLLYFDNRMTSDLLAGPADLETRAARLREGEPLRLAFSGRLINMKGADHLPEVAAELNRLECPFTMDIFGAGDLEPRIRSSVTRKNLSDRVRLRGVLDFRSELLPYMKSEVDLFVCCHRQGDPSCTYIETMGCGVPIIGYANEALAGMVSQSGAGWITRLDDPVELAQRIASLGDDREEVVKQGMMARRFAAEHTYEATFASRVNHLLACREAA